MVILYIFAFILFFSQQVHIFHLNTPKKERKRKDYKIARQIYVHR